jgi:predicted nuclease of predicted toxin-antitoxin system
MKLLFDENLSHQLVRRLADLFPDSAMKVSAKLLIPLEGTFSSSVEKRRFIAAIHVREVGLKAADDPVVWEYAKNNDLLIVSKDSDMHQRSFVFGYPPKVVWVRLGNCSTSDVERLLRRHFAAIKAFYEDDYASFLSLSLGAT